MFSKLYWYGLILAPSETSDGSERTFFIAGPISSVTGLKVL